MKDIILKQGSDYSMANITLINTAQATGDYLEASTTVSAETKAEVLIIKDIIMTMTASKSRWSDYEPNVYTVTITNNDPDNPFELDENQVIQFETDQFSEADVTIDDESVVVTGNTTEQVAVNAGVLSMHLKGPIASGTPTVITFDVNRVQS